MKPLDCVCHGKSGTGKTALVRYVLQQLSENTSALTFYVNCWENKSLNWILDRLLEEVGVHFIEENYSTKIARLKSTRTFTNYVNKLVELEYLSVERAKSRGNVRAFMAT